MKGNAVILGIDSGSTSGAAIMRADGARLASAQIERRDTKGRESFVRTAVLAALAGGHDLIVMREKWTAGGPFGGARTMAGLGASWGQWLEQLFRCAPFLPASRIVGVYPATWRAEVFGTGGLTTEGWERVAAEYVRQRFQVEAGPDEAVALCLCVYARTNPEALRLVQDRPRWLAEAALVYPSGGA